MAWNFRRSVKFGPVRLNFSKSGIGTSVGVRGFRVGRDAKGRTYTASSIPGTGIYNRQYSSARTPAVQSSESTRSPITTPAGTGTGNGLKLLLAFLAGGVVLSIAGALQSSPPAAQPVPAAVSAPVVPTSVSPAKRRGHGSKRTTAPGLRHPTDTTASHTPQIPPHPSSDEAPPTS